ncbi:MAG: NUDIX hydrolase [Candidatus Marinimicrobia bacterium]|jgi:ADP-ribose pyrophosphatase|nr:NUDIX hydrolase [Candidatus Neomarinimicrobiota bacterium]MBT3675633.1 NUDIX hydrolase [Candidatus Neomarinimicrobiota bacterium]MBT3763408.1 NUDIX hydrolase [Candidatus Neomarinimicrobiota bacterium]MBT4068088.1 NUDIX hydrolase [Candidatus Neomarinimicrobiota bacterium]MBT4271182.1 NUDIX hydrolase [Candidatus Neomarinimicrobiota bacterium]
MSDLKETKILSEQKFSGRLIDLYLDQVELPNGKTSTREWIDHPGAVCLIPILPDGNICLIRQFRYGPGEEFIEIPAGKLDKDEDPLDCAHRELEEEIGHRSNKLTFLTNIHPAIGFSNEKMWMYLAEDLIKTKHNLDPDEFLELSPTSLDDALAWVWSGKITDVKTIIGILWAEKLLRCDD